MSRLSGQRPLGKKFSSYIKKIFIQGTLLRRFLKTHIEIGGFKSVCSMEEVISAFHGSRHPPRPYAPLSILVIYLVGVTGFMSQQHTRWIPNDYSTLTSACSSFPTTFPTGRRSLAFSTFIVAWTSSSCSGVRTTWATGSKVTLCLSTRCPFSLNDSSRARRRASWAARGLE